MSSSVNKVILIGSIGKDPELRYSQAGGAICNLSLATNERWKNKAGEPQEQTTWHKLTCFNKTAELAGQYLHKGSRIYVEGKLQNREYEKDGQKRYVSEIFVHAIQFLDRKYEQPDGPINVPAPAPQSSRQPAAPRSMGYSFAEPGSDEDVPF